MSGHEPHPGSALFADRRALLCRAVIYGAPVLAAVLSVSLFYLGRRSPVFGVQSALGTALFFNAFLAAAGSAAATVFLSGRQGVRLAGAIAYAVFGLLVYLIVTISGLRWLEG